MWKVALAFVAFACLAIFILSKGGDIDMGGKKNGADAIHSEPAPVPVPAAK